MKVAFLPGSCAPFHGKTLDERPLGGTETAIIRLAHALAMLDHEVVVFSSINNPPLTEPLYIPLSAMSEVRDVDVLIVIREIMGLFCDIRCSKRFFWTGDSYDQLQHIGLGDRRVINRITNFLAVSGWQADRVCDVSGYPREKAHILTNGVDLELFSSAPPRHRKRLIYSSSPYRGLEHLARLWPAVVARHPDSELVITSGLDVYDGTGNYNLMLRKRYEPLFQKLSKMPNCVLRGNLLQRDLALQFCASSILAYPNTFEETSCITALEAMAAGCATVTSRKGALPETLGDAALFVDGEPGTAEYDNTFVEQIVRLLDDDTVWNTLSSNARKRSKEFSWIRVAEKFTNWISTDD